MSIDLDEIRAEADAEYVSYDINVGGKSVRLLNPLRMSKANRKRLGDLQESLKVDGVDQEAVLRDMLSCVVETKANLKVLTDAIGDDLALLVRIFANYSKATRVGEASVSRD